MYARCVLSSKKLDSFRWWEIVVVAALEFQVIGHNEEKY